MSPGNPPGGNMAKNDGPVSPESFAAGMSTRALHCRELGHNWRDYTVTWNRKAKCYERALRCSSCRTIRHQVVSTDGTALSNRYTYPDGYLAQNVDGPVDRAVFRMEAITRFLDAHQEGAA